MRSMIMTTVAAALAAVLAGAVPASATEYQVQMLNKGPGGMMVFEPSFLKIASGDTVHFLASDKGHNVMSVDGMMPEGAVPFQGKMNEDVTITFDKPGVYGVECKPHYGMGMVGLVVVGDPVNLAEAKTVPQKGKAKKRFEDLFGSMGQ
ncbi:MAG TPA: pseudoazurin [Dongiaceae bacterium]